LPEFTSATTWLSCPAAAALCGQEEKPRLSGVADRRGCNDLLMNHHMFPNFRFDAETFIRLLFDALSAFFTSYIAEAELSSVDPGGELGPGLTL
jgi:hypothetical protein